MLAAFGRLFAFAAMIAIAIYAFIGTRLRGVAVGMRGLHWFNRIGGSLMIMFGKLLAVIRRPAGH